MVFCNKIKSRHHRLYRLVTILILIDGFLQYNNSDRMTTNVIGHNPYFNRWFSAILNSLIAPNLDGKVTILILIDGFLQ